MSGAEFTTALWVVGCVIVIATLLSGLIDRAALPQVAVFLLLGALLGKFGTGLFATRLDSPILLVVATLSLALVLFTDAMTLNLAELKSHLRLVARILGPGTLVPAALIAIAAWHLLELPAVAAAILGAALASTDPVLLRGLQRRTDIPAEARLALRLESGLNDIVLLPIIITAMLLLGRNAEVPWPKVALSLFVLGPLAGVAVGFIAVALLDRVRRSTGIRRDYESIYSLGVAFTAFGAAESLHASGFLAAFAAGLTIVWFDVELCDCFVEYGETTAEMLLLLTFVLLGSGPIWQGLGTVDASALLFVALALMVRPVVMYLSLLGSGLDRRNRLLVSWYGPRGLSSLLLVLLPLFAGIPDMTPLFEVCALVVLASVSLHGGSVMLLARRSPASPLASGSESGSPQATAGSASTTHDPATPVRITIEELRQTEERGEPVLVADIRSARSASDSPEQAAGAVRLDPDQTVRSARALNLPRDSWIALYCA